MSFCLTSSCCVSDVCFMLGPKTLPCVGMVRGATPAQHRVQPTPTGFHHEALTGSHETQRPSS